MCICFVAVGCGASPTGHALVLCSNRDEYYGRAASPCRRWADGVFGARDEEAQGTWLGVEEATGRAALLTNVREVPAERPHGAPPPPSRGGLVTGFLRDRSGATVEELARAAGERAPAYRGFNLLLVGGLGGGGGDDAVEAYAVHHAERGVTSRVERVTAGSHVLSNAALDTPWPKAKRGLGRFDACLGRHAGSAGDAAAEDALADELMREVLLDDMPAHASDAELPRTTGFPLEWERALGSVFVSTDTERGKYGTRNSQVILVRGDGTARVLERDLAPDGETWRVARHELRFGVAGAAG